jgi:hypothetical protein
LDYRQNRIPALEHFRFTYCHFEIEQGGFFRRKKPPGIEDPVSSGIENAGMPAPWSATV